MAPEDPDALAVKQKDAIERGRAAELPEKELLAWMAKLNQEQRPLAWSRAPAMASLRARLPVGVVEVAAGHVELVAPDHIGPRVERIAALRFCKQRTRQQTTRHGGSA